MALVLLEVVLVLVEVEVLELAGTQTVNLSVPFRFTSTSGKTLAVAGQENPEVVDAFKLCVVSPVAAPLE